MPLIPTGAACPGCLPSFLTAEWCPRKVRIGKSRETELYMYIHAKIEEAKPQEPWDMQTAQEQELHTHSRPLYTHGLKMVGHLFLTKKS